METGTTGCFVDSVILQSMVSLSYLFVGPVCKSPVLSLETVSTKQKLTSLKNDTKIQLFFGVLFTQSSS